MGGCGLNLYVFLNYGNAARAVTRHCKTADDPSTCNYRFDASPRRPSPTRRRPASHHLGGVVAGRRERTPARGGMQSTVSNADLIQGAIQGLQSEGSYYGLRLLQLFGLVYALKPVPAHVMAKVRG